jgi:starvation-inducible outer membrane lipoprotein
MFRLSLLFSVLLSACYIPPRPLKSWEEDRLHRRGNAVPCSAFMTGQNMGNAGRVVRVTSRSVTIKSKDGFHYSIPCN